MANYEMSEQFFKESIDSFEKSDCDEGDLFYVYSCLIDVLYEQDKFTETLPWLDTWWGKIMEYESDVPNDTRYRFAFHCHAALIYTELGLFDEAYKYITGMNKHMRGEMIAKNNLRYVYMRYYELNNEYEKALMYCDSIYQSFLKTGDMQGALSMYSSKAGLLYKKGKYQAAADIYSDLVQINDSLKKIEMNSQIDDLRMQYEVDKHIAEKERSLNYLIMAAIISVVLALTLFIWIFYSRRVTIKNRGLVRRIEEQDYLEKELEKERAEKLRIKKLLQKDHSENDDVEEELFMEL